MGNNDAREQLEVAKAECVRLEARVAELEAVRRLHEVATERTVQLAAVIEKAKAIVDAGRDKVLYVLSSVDTGAALRERDAEKWEEGFDVGHYAPSEMEWFGDAEPTCDCKVNPYREEADRG